MLDQVLNTAEDLIVIDSKDKDRVVFAFPFKREVAKHYFNETLADKREKGVEGFNRHWQYDNKTGLITGSSTLLTLRLGKKAGQKGFWVPTVEEAMLLNKNSKLTNRVYRDYGIVVYSNDRPNQKIAEGVIEQAKGRELPLVVPFKALDYEVDNNFPNGVAVFLAENLDGIRAGEEAQKIISQFSYPGNSGACRVLRDRGGYLGAGWEGFDGSDIGGRVDWMCAKGTRADLETAHKGVLKRQYDVEIKRLQSERDQKEASFLESLKS